MKNILCIGKYNGIIGGIERYMQQSAGLLRKNNFSVHYLYTEEGGKEQELFASAFDSIGRFSPESSLISSADTVIVHNIIPPELLKYLPAKKTFFFAHDHNIYCRRHHYYWPVGRINCHRKYNRFICKLCSLGRNSAPPLSEYRKLPALVLSDFMRDNLLKNGFKKVFKLPAFIKTVDKEHKFMPGNVLRILFLGQLIRGKGADLMLKTLAKLDIPFSCTIAGDGNDRQMLEKMVRRFKLEKKVQFTGFVSDTEKLWEQCDVFFFPIRWQEPFGLVALEAMAHGVPVIAFALGGIREHLTDACGALIPEKNIQRAAEALTLFFRTPELLKNSGDQGLLQAKNKFSEKQFVEQFKKILESMP
ncbi:MAG: glycosyltransferase family 4 protein [Lentisphaeria bacterium]|nr:glycosyltransferase family 4 protein [Lentisphaeria bacterium]